MTDMMKVVDVTEPGSPDNLVVANQPIPEPAEGQVLIEIAAAGVNRPDIVQRQGNYPVPKGASEILGLEVSGTVVKLGPNVDHLNVGDKVCALLAGGGYAEYCVAEAGTCLRVPDGLSFEEAASLPETFFTVWRNVFDIGRLSEGEVLLVHGGTSGIGVTAIQMAVARGAIVYATAGSDEKCRACEDLGARRCFNYKTEDFVEGIKSQSEFSRVDVVLDMIGGDYVPKNMAVMSYGARHVSIAVMGGAKATTNFGLVMMKNLTLTGSTLRPRSVAEKASIARNLEQYIWPLIEAKKIKPIVHEIISLDDARQAHELMESSNHIGKIVLKVR